MPIIKLSLFINAPRERCFDLSRSLELHQVSTFGTHEKAIAGVTSGLIELGEEVTWRARHFGIYQNLTSRITAMKFPDTFSDCQVKGAFKNFDHTHIFLEQNGGTLMTDVFNFEAPLGFLGKLACILFLTTYMRHFLIRRNNYIKRVAEGEEWRKYLM